MRTIPVSCLVMAATFSLLLSTVNPAPVLAESGFRHGSKSAKWAVILSPGPRSGVPWGGYHMTITGYSNEHTCLAKDNCRKMLATVGHGVQGWNLHGKLPALKLWKGTWTQTFESKALDQLATALAGKGFHSIKGPQHSKTPWHISLSRDEKKSIKTVKGFKDEKIPWHLWLAPEPGESCKERGTGCPRWTRIE